MGSTIGVVREAPLSVRLSPALRVRLAESARRNGRSFHAEVVRRLSAGVGRDERVGRVMQSLHAASLAAVSVPDFEPAEPPVLLVEAATVRSFRPDLKPTLALPAKKAVRTVMCEHRIPAGAYCYRCDA